MPKKEETGVLALDLDAKGFYDNGHPYKPGSGPPGQTCGTCAKCVTCEGLGKPYHTCRITKIQTPYFGVYYPGRVLETDPACLSWEPAILKEGLMLVPTHIRGTGYHLRR